MGAPGWMIGAWARLATTMHRVAAVTTTMRAAKGTIDRRYVIAVFLIGTETTV